MSFQFFPFFQVEGPLRLLSGPLDERIPGISFRSPLLAAPAQASLEPSSFLTAPRQAARSSRPFFPRRAPVPREVETGGLSGENVGRPEKQVTFQILFPKEGVESLVRFGRKAVEKRKELLQTHLPLTFLASLY